jgi:putative DNA-invertase from lambdoid prophage Rac
MKNKIYAYIRVSTLDQKLENQKIQILNYAKQNNIHIDEVIEEKISGIEPLSRRKLGILLEKLKPKDTIIFTEMSRFGRNSSELVSYLQKFVKINIYFIFLKEGLNTKEKHSKLMTNLMISIFSGIYQFERDLLSERTLEGLRRVKLEGKSLGRPKDSKNSRLKLDIFFEKIKKYKEMGLNNTAISKLLQVHPKTVCNFIKKRNLNII